MRVFLITKATTDAGATKSNLGALMTEGKLPKWMSDKSRLQQQNRSSARQELKHARKMGGRTQAGSGSSHRAKGDVVSVLFMDELKETNARSFSITEQIIKKVIRAASQFGREPRLIIDFRKLKVRAVVTFEDL